ncbi:hypothetical protein GCM10010371_03960 [Streptomyces subrutilus]|uniref:Uncharacterized protein n=1 Tax=Streptomyces subrutilus TaxID=36818 RepID=A0A918V069_9ACTN|nr:hypothetical protein GCM10010371_03960 [Streptomyces subrutilus]
MAIGLRGKVESAGAGLLAFRMFAGHPGAAGPQDEAGGAGGASGRAPGFEPGTDPFTGARGPAGAGALRPGVADCPRWRPETCAAGAGSGPRRVVRDAGRATGLGDGAVGRRPP